MNKTELIDIIARKAKLAKSQLRMFLILFINTYKRNTFVPINIFRYEG